MHKTAHKIINPQRACAGGLSICRAVSFGSQRSLGFKPWVKYQIQVGDILSNKKTHFLLMAWLSREKLLNPDQRSRPPCDIW